MGTEMNLRELVKSIGRGVNRCIPKNPRKILFESNSDYCDNTRAVYDYLVANGYGEKYRFVWCVKDPETFHADGMEGTKLVTFQKKSGFPAYFFQMASAKYVFYTHYVPPFCNAKAQTVVNLWHGTPLKSIKGHVHPSKLFNCLLSPSDYFDPILADSFDADPGQLVQCGYPRNDRLFEQTDCLEKLGIQKSDYRSVILWMPTFRRPADGTYQDAAVTATGLPLVETSAMLEQLNTALQERELCLIIKLHPGQDLSGVNLVTLSHIRMLTNRELDEKAIQLYHLVGMSDMLLTDYSSIYFDYLLLDRPIGFIIDDMEAYQQNRGFVTDDPLALMPGEQIRTPEDLLRFLDGAAEGRDEFADDRRRVNALANRFQGPGSAERFVLRFLGGK